MGGDGGQLCTPKLSLADEIVTTFACFFYLASVSVGVILIENSQ